MTIGHDRNNATKNSEKVNAPSTPQTIPAEVKANIPQISQPNKNMPVIPYDARAPYINVALKEYPYLSLYNSDRHNDAYEFKNSGLCPGCEKEHNNGKVVGRGIKGSYYIKCRSSPNEKEISLPDNSSGKKSKAPPKRTQSDQLIPLKKNLPKKMREDVMNSVVNRLNVSKLEVNFSIDREGEHQIDCYQIFGSGICPICAKTHWYLDGKWWIDRQGNKRYYLKCDNIKEPGILLDEVLEVYSKNFDLNQPIPWSHALMLPITVEA